MVQLELLLGLLKYDNAEAWSEALFALVQRHGFNQMVYGMIPSKQKPLEQAFLCSNYSPQWRSKYDTEKLHYVDPTVSHCLGSTLPLVWEPQTFKTPEQRQLYEEACGHGIRSGITYPIHGASGEFGVISFASEARAGKKFRQELEHTMPDMALIRDYVFESSLKFALPAHNKAIQLTKRELESLKWAMEGKTSWEISIIMSCSEATTNFHMGNIRRKFQVATRQQAVVKAIRLGLINPG